MISEHESSRFFATVGGTRGSQGGRSPPVGEDFSAFRGVFKAKFYSFAQKDTLYSIM